MGPKLSVSVRKAGVSAMDKFPRTDVVDYPEFLPQPCAGTSGRADCPGARLQMPHLIAGL
jgi:hypothetical protein